jgi:hypothetical protein
MFHLKGNKEIYYVTVHLNLPDFPLQYLVRLSVSMNPSPGIYGGTEAALAHHYYKLILSHSMCLLMSYAQL